MSRNKELAVEIGVSAAQAQTLIVLLEHPVLSYRIVQELQLFPVGKMHERVLAPLQEDGWIILHSLPPEDDVKGGRPLKAFSLARGKRTAIKKALATADDRIDQRRQKAFKLSSELAAYLGLETD